MHYEVTRQIGEGGIGRIFEAVHRPSGRVVAIKTLRSAHGASASQRLLLDEAAAAAQLAHPHVVELLDVGRDDDGAMFLVMELVTGSSLESWSSSFPGLRTVLRAFEDILDALAAAHAQGIVHGDLKPANVLLTADGRVKLTDFGIAHVIDPLRLAERRGVQGTPYYMAPEQLVDLAAIGPSTDLYAIGVMLYELIAGTEPYSSEGTLPNLLARKIAELPPLTPRAGLVTPTGLETLVMELLDSNPRTRPRFAARVRAAIREFAQHASDERHVSRVEVDSNATIVSAPLGTEPTIQSTPELAHAGGTTRSVPFSLPSAGGAEPQVSLHRLRALPLVGRSEQTERLSTDMAATIAVGCPRGVLISGRAGEGKTRLVRHAFAEVERTGTMLGAAASFDETIANAQVGLRACMLRMLGAPIGTLADTLAGPWRWLARVAQPELDGSAVGGTSQTTADGSAVGGTSQTTVDGSAAGGTSQTTTVDFTRMYDWLTPGAEALSPAAGAEVAAMCVLAASRVFPVFLWLDDVAWSRDGAMELFVRLLERNDARVFVVGTLRSGTAEHGTVREWLRSASRLGARLEVLRALDVRERASLIATAGPVAPEVAEAIAAVLDEPTLVVVETVRAWIEEGDLVPSDRGYVLREGARASDLVVRGPEVVLASRVERLLVGFGEERAAAERVLAHAALLGLRFEDRALRACEGIRAHVDPVLDRALLTGLLRVDGRGAYRFEHRLFVDVIAARVAARPDAASFYASTADALVAAYGRRNMDSGLATATLYRLGGKGEDAARCLKNAIRSFSRASVFAAADRAIDLFDRWNEEDALPPVHLHRAWLDVARGIRTYFELDYPPAREYLERALATFQTLGRTGDVHTTLFDISSTYFYQDRFADVVRCVAFVSEPVVDPLAHARGYHRLAEIASIRGDLEGAIAYQRRAAEFCAGHDAYFEFVCDGTLCDYLLAGGYIDEAVAACERAAKASERARDRFLNQEFEHTLAAIDSARGHYAAARARIAPRLESLVARRDHWYATAERAHLLLCLAGLGEPRPVLERATSEFVESYRAVPHDEFFTWWALRNAATHLKNLGHQDLAAQITTMHDARLARIARAFNPSDDGVPPTQRGKSALPPKPGESSG